MNALRFPLAVVSGVVVMFSSQAALARDPVRDMTGRTIKQHTERAIKRTGNSWEKLINDPVGYTFKLPFKLFEEACGAPARVLGYNYEGQARGKWKKLPDELVTDIQPFYSTKLANVRYAEDIRIANAPAVTFGNLIYFDRKIDFSNDADLWDMLHELEHTVHYRNANDVHKLCEYTVKAISHGFRHDSIDWEKAANRKASWVMKRLFEIWRDQEPEQLAENEVYIENLLSQPIEFYMGGEGERQRRYAIRPNEWIIFTARNDGARYFDIDYEYERGVDQIRLAINDYYQFDENNKGELELFTFESAGERPRFDYED